jgi:hypothetical protein
MRALSFVFFSQKKYAQPHRLLRFFFVPVSIEIARGAEDIPGPSNIKRSK